MNTMKSLTKETPIDGKDWKVGLEPKEVPIPNIKLPSDVKIKVVGAAICGTDVSIYKSKDSMRKSMKNNKKPYIITGHEFCGKIVDAGDTARVTLAYLLRSKGLWVKNDDELRKFIENRSIESIASDPKLIDMLNQKFMASSEMHVVCGICPPCRAGNGHACVNTIINGIHEDGCFTEYLLVPVQNVSIFFNDSIPDKVIAFMDAIGNAIHTVQSIDLAGKTVAVLGAGVIGLVSIAVAKMWGASKIFVTDFMGKDLNGKIDRLALARQFGADYTFDMAIPGSKQNLVETVMAVTDGMGVENILEMSGNYSAYEDAFKIIRPAGTMSLLGLPSGNYDADFSSNIIFKGITVKGIIGRRMFDTWDRMIEVLTSGLAKKLVDSGFITHDLPLSKFDDGFRAINEGKALKVVLRP